MSMPEATVPERREGVIRQFLGLRRGPWEWLATIIIALGVIMLMQPFSLDLYGWSFATIIVGTAMFVIASHFRK